MRKGPTSEKVLAARQYRQASRAQRWKRRTRCYFGGITADSWTCRIVGCTDGATAMTTDRAR